MSPPTIVWISKTRMSIRWEQRFNQESHCTRVLGFELASVDDCRKFFAERVAARLREADGATLIEEHLVELGDTGFDISGLQKQIQSPPKAKDWEIGEIFTEVVLEDFHEAKFPWHIALDKRTPKASLPGPDLVGFHRNKVPRFLFGEVKSSSEGARPPQVVDSGSDCLLNQVRRLLTSELHRQQLIQWLLVRAKGTDWEPVFNDALMRYAPGVRDAWLVGVLVRGERIPSADDICSICEPLGRQNGDYEASLIVFYVPFHKDKWVELIYGEHELS